MSLIQLAIRVSFTGATDQEFTCDLGPDTPRVDRERRLYELLRRVDHAVGDLHLGISLEPEPIAASSIEVPLLDASTLSGTTQGAQ